MMKEPGTAKKETAHKEKHEAFTEERPQGIWSGTVSFSLVAIPVRIVKSVDPGRVSFHLLHTVDNSPLERTMFCPREESAVPPDEIVRGFEIEPGKYIMITDEELASVSPERSRTIEITEFVEVSDVDPIFYDHPYFLVPLKGGEKSYRLLAESLHRANKAGIAKFVLDDREHVVLITSRDEALTVTTLHYNDEILASGGLVAQAAGEPSAQEIAIIKKTIKRMTSGFTPEKYSNDRRKKLLDIINKKVKKKTEVEAPDVAEEEQAEGMADLMSAL